MNDQNIKKYEKITGKELYDIFCKMFPNHANNVTNFKKLGSRVISIIYEDGNSLVFLYVNENDWQLGTKLWRKRPKFLNNKKNKEPNKVDQNKENKEEITDEK